MRALEIRRDLQDKIIRSVCLSLLFDFLQTAESANLKVLPSEFGAGRNRLNSRSLFSELSLYCSFFLLTSTKPETEQEPNLSFFHRITEVSSAPFRRTSEAFLVEP